MKLGLRGITFVSSAGNDGNHLGNYSTSTLYSNNTNAMLKDMNKLLCKISIDEFPASSP